MNRNIKVGLLSLIVTVQALTLVGGFIAYEQMSETMHRLELNIKELLEEAYPDLRDGPGSGLSPPNPFAPLIPLVLLGLLLTLVLLIDQVRHR